MHIIIKVGGNELDDPAFLLGLTHAISTMPEHPIIVHGGGKELTAVLERMGAQSRFVEGLRVTDETSLAVAEMVLRGRTNLRVVSALVAARLPALGLSGVDAGLVTVEKWIHPDGDLGFVGRPIAVESERLRTLLRVGFLPVIAPICIGADGQCYNVNGDHLASAIAAALDAEQLIFLTNVQGVLINGSRVATLTAAQVQTAIDDGTIFGGMVPKVRSALDALDRGVRRTIITNLVGLTTLVAGGDAGTAIVK